MPCCFVFSAWLADSLFLYIKTKLKLNTSFACILFYASSSYWLVPVCENCVQQNTLFYVVLCQVFWYRHMLITHDLENSVVQHLPCSEGARLKRATCLHMCAYTICILATFELFAIVFKKIQVIWGVMPCIGKRSTTLWKNNIRPKHQ